MGNEQKSGQLPLWALAVFSALYLSVSIAIAAWKPPWYDEYFTFHLARLPRIADLRTALARGTDLNPPLYYLAARASMALVGETILACRLPSLIGVWVMALAIYRFVSRRCPAAYAWAALGLPLATVASTYAYEGRTYGLVLGLSGIALVAWQEAAEAPGWRRGLALVGLAASLAAAVGSHYYSIMLLVPFGLGELARARGGRRFDLPMAVALILGAAPLTVLGPLIRRARAESSGFWARPGWLTGPRFYSTLLAEALPPLVALLILAALWPRKARDIVPSPGWPGPPTHETIAAAALAALPLLEVALAKLVTGAFTFRYALPSVIGIAVLFAFAMARAARGGIAWGFATAAALLSWFAAGEAGQVLSTRSSHLGRAALYRDLEAIDAEGSLPLVIADPVAFVPLASGAPEALAGRLWHLTVGDARPAREVFGLAAWAPSLQVEPYRDFLATHDRFLVCGAAGDPLIGALRDEGVRIDLLQGGGPAGAVFRMEVTRHPGSPDR